MTHVENIPHILKYGVTSAASPNANPAYIPIGDSSLISYRTDKYIQTIHGESIRLGQFIPFYFGIRMPMLYVIQHGGNYVPTAVNPDQIIYVVVSLQSLLNVDINFYFTDGHATDALTTTFDRSHIDQLQMHIDWNAVTAKYWKGEGIDIDVKRRKQAEFLIDGDIATEHIAGYLCYSCYSSEKLASFGIPRERIKIVPNAYF